MEENVSGYGQNHQVQVGQSSAPDTSQMFISPHGNGNRNFDNDGVLHSTPVPSFLAMMHDEGATSSRRMLDMGACEFTENGERITLGMIYRNQMKILDKMEQLERKVEQNSSCDKENRMKAKKDDKILIPNRVRTAVRNGVEHAKSIRKLEWSTAKGLTITSPVNVETTDCVRDYVRMLNIGATDPVIDAALKTYFKSTRAADKLKENPDKMIDSRRKSRRAMRKCDKRDRRLEALPFKTSYTQEQVARFKEALELTELQSTDESAGEDDGREVWIHRKREFESVEFTTMKQKVDAKWNTKVAKPKSKRMRDLTIRREGPPSEKPRPDLPSKFAWVFA